MKNLLVVTLSAFFYFLNGGYAFAQTHDAKPIKRVPPAFPSALERSGHCNLEFDVSAAGEVLNISVLSCSEEILGDYAYRSVDMWKYEPAFKDGFPVWQGNISTTINFDLLDEEGNRIPEDQNELNPSELNKASDVNFLEQIRLANSNIASKWIGRMIWQDFDGFHSKGFADYRKMDRNYTEIRQHGEHIYVLGRAPYVEAISYAIKLNLDGGELETTRLTSQYPNVKDFDLGLDGSIYAAGETSGDGYVRKVKNDQRVWKYKQDDKYSSSFHDIVVHKNNIAAAGFIGSNEFQGSIAEKGTAFLKPYVKILSEDGKELCSRTLDDLGEMSHIFSVSEKLIGISKSKLNKNEGRLYEFSEQCDLVSEKRINGFISSIFSESDGSGFYSSHTSGGKGVVQRIAHDGSIAWKRNISFGSSDAAFKPEAIDLDAKGNSVIIGLVENTFVVLKISRLGNLVWWRPLFDRPNDTYDIDAMRMLSDGTAVLAGHHDAPYAPGKDEVAIPFAMRIDGLNLLGGKISLEGDILNSTGKVEGKAYAVSPKEVSLIQERKRAKSIRLAEAKGSKDSWGNLLGQVVKHGTGAVISSGAVSDIDAVGALTAVNAYAGLATGDSIQSIEAEQKGLIDSHLQKREEQQKFAEDLNAEVNHIKQQQQSLADENQRLKLELENARMKAELARLNGGQSANSVVTPRTEAIDLSESQNDVGTDTTDNENAGSKYSTGSGGIEMGPEKELVTSTFAVCFQSPKAKIKPGKQYWICDGPLQKLWATEATLLGALNLSGCDNAYPVGAKATGMEAKQGEAQFIFSCSNKKEGGRDRDILGIYGFSGGHYTYNRPQLTTGIHGVPAMFGYEGAEYRPGRTIDNAFPEE